MSVDSDKIENLPDTSEINTRSIESEPRLQIRHELSSEEKKENGIKRKYVLNQGTNVIVSLFLDN